MPEINTQLKKDTLQAPQSAKLLDLPQRRSRFVTILIPIVILLILIGGTLAFFKYYHPAPAPIANTNTETAEKPALPEGTSFYFARNTDEAAAVSLYKYSQNSSEPDQKITTFDSKDIYSIGKWVKPFTYVVDTQQGKLQILDAASGTLEPLFDLPANKSTRQTALSADNQWLAYAVNTDADEKGAGTAGEIWLYNVNTKQSKQLVKKTDFGIYQGFAILGWRDNDKEIIASSIACDGGACGGDIYEINVQTGEAVTIKNPNDKSAIDFLFGELSPNHDQWLYQYCAQHDQAVRDQEDSGYPDACTSGAELKTYDFGTKQTKTIYQNLRFEKNVDKSALRVFMSYQWQDDQTVIAAVPDALLSIPLSEVGKTDPKVETILVYDQTVPQEYRNSPLTLHKVSPAMIVYSRANEDWFVLDRVSQKITNINSQTRKEDISAWLD